MAVQKICGVETEFGIIVKGVAESNPIAASSVLINAYLHSLGRVGHRGAAPKVGWDFEDESPGRDARGDAPEDSLAPEVETHLVNAVLTNGARYYVDHAHPELSTPECADARSVVVWDRAAEVILARSMDAARDHLPAGQEIVVHKNNSDGKGNSYGCHENYLMDRSLPFAQIVRQVMPHFVTRQVFTGSGKVGSELPGAGPVPYQITQRADFFEEEVGLETTLKRPIVNTRDEPHADAQRYRRLHVIVGDANLAEVATFLKVGTTAFVLAMIEDDALPWDFRFADPVRALQQVSTDLSLAQPLELAGGSTATALEIQWELLDRSRKYAETEGTDAVGGESVAGDVLDRWERVLGGLEHDPDEVADQVDWVAKKRLLDGFAERHGLDDPTDPRLAALALQYHDLRPDKSLAARAGLARLTTDAEVERAVTEPPDDTRAYFRGRCLSRFGEHIVAANWDSMVFDLGDEPLRRVPMMEPARGGRAQVGTLLDESNDLGELVERLGA